MRSIVVTPTFNEKDNTKDLIEEVLSSDTDIHIVIVDDQSPDDTAQVVREFSQRSSRVHLIVRDKPRGGRALADIEGMRYALKEGYDYIFQMDADLSHQPKYIPQFLKAIQTHDLVIGSRLIKGGGILHRNFIRNFITHLANLYIRCVLGLRVKDCTSGFRCYRRHVLKSIGLEGMMSKGPSLLEEILYECHKRHFDICEIPIIFVDRKKGKSKLGVGELLKILFIILKIRFKK